MALHLFRTGDSVIELSNVLRLTMIYMIIIDHSRDEIDVVPNPCHESEL